MPRNMKLQRIEDIGVSRSGKSSWFEYQAFISNLHNESKNKKTKLENVLYENLELIKKTQSLFGKDR